MTIQCPKCKAENPDTQSFCGDCGTQLTPAKDISAQTKTIEAPIQELKRGTLFADRYEIIEELGIGGMGKVYRVEDTKAKEEIALKLIKPEIAADKKTIDRFRNELTTARKIRHKNICGMYDLGEDRGSYYITMEYVPGEDLKSLIRRMGRIPTEKAISITKQISEGLSEAHTLGVVHRDLKPSNIMIDKDGNSRIMDFGIARSLKGKGITGAGVIIGTPEYMSPEQVEGKDIDHRSDIYSLGVILYEMVTGRVPFDGDTALSIAMRHKGETPKDPKEYNAQVPDDLNSLILKCLEKNKESRFQSAGEIQSELENIEKGIPTTDRAIPRRKPLTSKEITVSFSVKKLFIPALVIIAILIVGLILWRPWSQKTEISAIPSGTPSLAILYFKNNTGDQSLNHWRSALSDWLITDLTQSKYIKVLRSNRLYTILQKLSLLDAENYTLEDLKAIASEGMATHILLGSLSKAGDTFRLDYELQNSMTGELISSNSVSGNGEAELPKMIDEATRLIKANLNLTLAQREDDIDEEVGIITTSSPEAYKYYEEASHYYRQGENLKSIEFYEKAIEIDPEFALAYRDLAAAYSNTGYAAKRNELLQKAFNLSHRISQRERLRIQGDFFRYEREYDRAIEAYSSLLALYPDDWIGNNGLGFVYINLGDRKKAVEYFKVNVDNRVEAVNSYSMLVRLYDEMGRYEEAVDVCQAYLNSFQHNNRIRWRLAQAYTFLGQFDLAIEEANKLDSSYALFEGPWILGDIYMYRGDFDKAEEEYLKISNLEEKNHQRRGREWLAYLYVLQGRFEDAIDQTKLGIEIIKSMNETNPEAYRYRWLSGLYSELGRWEDALENCERALSLAREEKTLLRPYLPLAQKGRIYLKMGLFDEADKIRDELKGFLEEENNNEFMGVYYHFLGEIELSQENFKKAIDMYEKAIALLPSEGQGDIKYFNSLGIAYFKMGDFDKARESYERITTYTRGRRMQGHIYAKSFYMLGKIYEAQSDNIKAIEHYEKFLDLWKDADPGIAEKDDAKERLERLTN